MRDIAICDAISGRNLLSLRYGYGSRTVEPHAHGASSEGHALLRAYQVGGYSKSGDSTGWKLLRVDETTSLSILPVSFTGPRTGYRPNDKSMAVIYCQL